MESRNKRKLIIIPGTADTSQGGAEHSLEMRSTINQMVKRSGIGRFRIIGRMSEYLGRQVSEAQLNRFTRSSDPRARFPLEFAPALEMACGSFDLLYLHARMCGFTPVAGKDTQLMELEQIEQQQRLLGQKRLEVLGQLTANQSQTH